MFGTGDEDVLVEGGEDVCEAIEAVVRGARCAGAGRGWRPG
jgi:hypothetical protein